MLRLTRLLKQRIYGISRCDLVAGGRQDCGQGPRATPHIKDAELGLAPMGPDPRVHTPFNERGPKPTMGTGQIGQKLLDAVRTGMHGPYRRPAARETRR